MPEAKPRSDLHVRDLMTTEVFTLEQNQSVTEVDALMEAKEVHHIPVVEEEDGLLVGLVSARDVFANALLRAAGYGSRGAERLKQDLRIKEVMSTEVRSIDPGVSVVEAVKIMRESGIGCLPVVIHGKLIGMLTANDLLELIAQGD
ncbi:MAG: CBS domain-containing protein [Myxococcales bacterium]|nr:CBS domain-containing protein [Myxococcales bacterium]MDD9964844.1 CBS domain-containing protein [Myxococcales bacterium]